MRGREQGGSVGRSGRLSREARAGIAVTIFGSTRVPDVRVSPLPSRNETQAIVRIDRPAAERGSRTLAVSATAAGETLPRRGFYARHGKRGSDVVLAAMLLVVLMPLIAIVALVVLLTAGLPVFYGSPRIGRDGATFSMWKFRTMVRDADVVFERWKDTHPDRAGELLTNWRLDDDPRVTALGRFLRKSSLDELPQFWNALCGEMSIVGPRPYLARETLDPLLAPSIVAVRPGITGPFQVRGRKVLPPSSRMHVEAAYAAEMTPLNDILYLLRTVKPLIALDGH